MTLPRDSLGKLFQYGSTWVRADFHLHTKLDREFAYNADENYYYSGYVQALREAGIRVGVVSNHNKFGLKEFKTLRKTAKREEIFLLPGVELSVNDGANGIHAIVVFSDEWLENGQDYINQFLNVAFAGKTPGEYEQANGRSSLGLIETIKRLEDYHRDFFLVFAHVEEKSGLWNELEGGRIQELGEDEFFRRRALAFQKVRTRDKLGGKGRATIQSWLKNQYPAEVEGSDCKSLEQIGQGEKSYIKIGDFTFEAIKYALLDHARRIAAEPRKHEHSHILSATFDGGTLDGKTICFSPELNTIIGIRGSGKSSILEAVRYALGIPFGEKALDTEYKREVVNHVLGSGGKITVRAVDKRGQRYEIRRIQNEKPDVYVNDVLQPGISIRETILDKPIYFGQKDLSNTGKGFERDLVEKLLGEKLPEIRSRIDLQRKKVAEDVEQLKKLSDMEERKKEYQGKKEDAEFQLKFYKEHNVEEKLQKQIDFDADARKGAQVVSFIETSLSDLEEFINRYEDDLKNQPVYKSRQNEAFFETFFTIYQKLIVSFNQIKGVLVNGKQTLSELREKVGEFEELKNGLKEEFAEIERKLAEELKGNGAKAIRPDEFRRLRATIDQAEEMLATLARQDNQRKILEQTLLNDLTALNELWRDEFGTIEHELDKVNQNHSALRIRVEFKNDKEAFISYMRDIFRGSRVREATFKSLSDGFADFGAMYKEFGKVKETVGGASQPVFEKYFSDNLSALLTWQVPNRFIIEYHDKELKHHSLGQRASALILFILSQQENDVIIIDQPEDDLDNQTIYEDVIKLIHSLKPKTQFIFVTHNANLPVLGDAEQIIACAYTDGKIDFTGGSIDCPALQRRIVDIMEGGEEAFRQRRRIYEIWKPRDF